MWFSLKNDILGSQMKILKFLGIQPSFIVVNALKAHFGPFPDKSTSSSTQPQFTTKANINLRLGWIPSNYKIFNFKPKMSFLSENHKNDNYGIWFFKFLTKIAMFEMAIFRKKANVINRVNSVKFDSYHFCDFLSKMAIFA